MIQPRQHLCYELNLLASSRRHFTLIAVVDGSVKELCGCHFSCHENENLEKRDRPDPGVSLAGLGGTSVDARYA